VVKREVANLEKDREALPELIEIQKRNQSEKLQPFIQPLACLASGS
jgi:hypothetical protein